MCAVSFWRRVPKFLDVSLVGRMAVISYCFSFKRHIINVKTIELPIEPIMYFNCTINVNKQQHKTINVKTIKFTLSRNEFLSLKCYAVFIVP